MNKLVEGKMVWLMWRLDSIATGISHVGRVVFNYRSTATPDETLFYYLNMSYNTSATTKRTQAPPQAWQHTCMTRLHAGVDCDVEMVLYRVIYTHGYYGCQNQFTFHRPVLLLGSAQARGTVLRE